MRARVLVNAGGPWVSRLLTERLGITDHAGVRLVKGSHIVVPRLYEGEHAYILQNPDRRIVFAIPYEGEFTLVGTTDVPFEADPPRPVSISLMRPRTSATASTAISESAITPADVVWSYSGVRPLYRRRGRQRLGGDPRLRARHRGRTTARRRCLSVFGGKITTYRRLAEHALEKLSPYLPGMKPAWTDRRHLPGGDMPAGDFELFLAGLMKARPFLPEPLARRLAHAYGTRVELILGEATALDQLGRDFGGGLTEAEVDYLIAHEWARTSTDILWRRSKLGLHVPAGTAAALDAYLETKTAPLKAAATTR